jgi:effector-binding domain-containing protein
VREPVVDVVTVAPRLTAVVAQTTTWEQFPALWRQLLDEVYGFVRSREELSPTPAGPKWQNVMLYKDDAPAVEIGVLAATSFAPKGRVVPSRLPGGAVAVTVHRGDYATLGRAHEAVHRFAAERELALAGPRWEIYGHGDAGPDAPEIEISYLLA